MKLISHYLVKDHGVLPPSMNPHFQLSFSCALHYFLCYHLSLGYDLIKFPSPAGWRLLRAPILTASNNVEVLMMVNYGHFAQNHF